MTKNPLHNFIGQITVAAGHKDMMKSLRKLALSTAATLRKPGEAVRETFSSIDAIARLHDEEAASWRDPETLSSTEDNPIDACDLRFWLLLAEKAGVPSIPARQILSLSEDEFAMVSGDVHIPDFIRHNLHRRLEAHDLLPSEDEVPADQSNEAIQETRSRVIEKLYAAMDDVPSGYMVRSNISGGAQLKSLAGTGTLENADEHMQVSEDVKVGPGYITFGNRRCIDTKDDRIIKMFAGGHKSEIHFFARPWVTASRHCDGVDPHRAGSGMPDRGSWPCEWRVFIQNGKIAGVSSYYPWTEAATPEACHFSLEAVAQAEKILAEAKKMRIQTRFMDIELSRSSKNKEMKEVADRFPRDDLSFTLDFMETEEGLTLLEGGPGFTPIGGAFPCGFVGHGMTQKHGLIDCKIEGVAIRQMDHIHLAEPSTWKDGDRAGCILSWDQARALADAYEPEAAPGMKA